MDITTTNDWLGEDQDWSESKLPPLTGKSKISIKNSIEKPVISIDTKKPCCNVFKGASIALFIIPTLANFIFLLTPYSNKLFSILNIKSNNEILNVIVKILIFVISTLGLGIISLGIYRKCGCFCRKKNKNLKRKDIPQIILHEEPKILNSADFVK